MQIQTTKRGFPALWESGGGLSNTGSAQIITGRDGEPRRPVYIRRRGHLACGEHALITVHDGYYIVNVRQHRGDFSVYISRIVKTTVKDIDGERWSATAQVELVNEFSNGEWDKPLDPKLEPAVKAAQRKARDYHCRSAYYIDTSGRPEVSEVEKKRRQEEMRRQDAERMAKRKAKAEREARAKAKAETASKKAKEAGLGARLDAVNVRLAALGRKRVALGEYYFKWGWQSCLYTEEDVAYLERKVIQLERKRAEEDRKRATRARFRPKFEEFNPRIEALGLTVKYEDERVKLDGDYYGQPYSDEGLVEFAAELDKRERQAAQARAKAAAEAEYQRLKTQAVANKLPTDIRIWCRRGGRTNAGNGWVIGPNGQDRPNTGWTNPHSRRVQRYREGEMIWEQVLPGEVVLKWSKECTAAPHRFEIIYLPPEGLTEAQFERIQEIQDELERQWQGARGMASGKPSPPVGDGWGLCSKSSAATESGGNTTVLGDALRKAGIIK